MNFLSSAVLVFASDSDAKKNLNQIVRSHGYPFEQHMYETEDGYINRVIRISGPIGSNAKDNSLNGGPRRPVVIL